MTFRQSLCRILGLNTKANQNSVVATILSQGFRRADILSEIADARLNADRRRSSGDVQLEVGCANWRWASTTEEGWLVFEPPHFGVRQEHVALLQDPKLDRVDASVQSDFLEYVQSLRVEIPKLEAQCLVAQASRPKFNRYQFNW